MSSPATLETLTTAFHGEIVDLVKRYQFRDRTAICCHGVSVSQCYLMETLHRQGPSTMKELAGHLHLSVSTVTRVAAPLVDRGLLRRREGNDRRVRRLELTDSGTALFEVMWGSVYESEKMILEQFPPDQREELIRFLRLLNQAVKSWTGRCAC